MGRPRAKASAVVIPPGFVRIIVEAAMSSEISAV